MSDPRREPRSREDYARGLPDHHDPTAGVGGGNFASSMANINAFYPDRLKGWALGLNAGGGNLGVPVVQLVGLLVLATAGVEHPRIVLLVYIPLIVAAAVGAALVMDNLTTARNQPRAMRRAMREPHTYVMSFLYIGTFGSFIGFGFAFGQVLQNQFTTSFATPLAAAAPASAPVRGTSVGTTSPGATPRRCSTAWSGRLAPSGGSPDRERRKPRPSAWASVGGGAGNRTRVLRRFTRASPCAVRCASTRIHRSCGRAGVTIPVAA